jgi:hypothetical protein
MHKAIGGPVYANVAEKLGHYFENEKMKVGAVFRLIEIQQ